MGADFQLSSTLTRLCGSLSRRFVAPSVRAGILIPEGILGTPPLRAGLEKPRSRYESQGILCVSKNLRKAY